MKGQPSTCCEIVASTTSPAETIRNLEKGLKERDKIIEKKDKIIEKLNKTIREQGNRLRYYENENSPPSADSLEWKRQKV